MPSTLLSLDAAAMAIIQYSYLKPFLLALALVVSMNSKGSSAMQHHVVGNDRGWDLLSDLSEWTSHKTFRVGDKLWFAYSSAEQSVAEVKSHEEWEACDITNPIKLYNGGLDTIPLLEVGSRFFISGTIQDCQNGMKLHVNVVSANSTTTTALLSSIKVAEPPKSAAPISHFSWILLGSPLLQWILYCMVKEACWF